MIAAIYARKSTEQNAGGDEEKSVTRQIEHAKAYAAQKGWAVYDEYIHVDDGISGAEFVKRPGFLRLMNALKPKPAFQVLITSEESRLGREQIETAYALKQIITAGVRVFYYLEERERTLESPTDKLLLSVTAFADEMEREKARQRTHDALVRKARAGYVAGGSVYGYDNVEVTALDPVAGKPKRLHVERRINEAEAAVIHDEYSETLGTEFRKLEDALLSDTVGQLASSEPIQLRESASVAEALQRMTEQGRGAVVVIDDEGRLAGIFTDQEVIPRVLGAARDVQLTRLSEVMIRDPEVMRPDDRICYAVNRMTSMGCRTMPIVDEDRRPVGVVTVDDVAKWLAAIFPEAILNLRPGDRLKGPAQRDGG